VLTKQQNYKGKVFTKKTHNISIEIDWEDHLYIQRNGKPKVGTMALGEDDNKYQYINDLGWFRIVENET